MRGFCPPRQKHRGDSVLADQIAGILSARDFVRRGFCPRTTDTDTILAILDPI